MNHEPLEAPHKNIDFVSYSDQGGRGDGVETPSQMTARSWGEQALWDSLPTRILVVKATRLLLGFTHKPLTRGTEGEISSRFLLG